MTGKTINLITTILSTGCFVGKSKFAPGTLGSIIGIPIGIFMKKYISTEYTLRHYQPVISITNLSHIIKLNYEVVLYFCVFTLFAIFFSGLYISRVNKNSSDPKEVVIDEIVGQAVVSCMCSWNIEMSFIEKLPLEIQEFTSISFVVVVPFLLFRFFDIVKPWPIRLIDREVGGGLGIVMDDVLASFFAVFFYYLIFDTSVLF